MSTLTKYQDGKLRNRGEDNLDWLERTVTQKREAPPAAPVPPAPPEPEMPSAIMKGIETTAGMATGGIAGALEGATKLLFKAEPHPEDVGRGTAIEVASGLAGKAKAAKQIFDSLIQIFLSPGAGIGAGMNQRLENVSPELRRMEVIPGGPGGLAPLLRAMVGGRAFASDLTPEEKAREQGPMTLGEIIDIYYTLVTPLAPGAIRGAKARITAKPEQKALPAWSGKYEAGAAEAVKPEGPLALPPGAGFKNKFEATLWARRNKVPVPGEEAILKRIEELRSRVVEEPTRPVGAAGRAIERQGILPEAAEAGKVRADRRIGTEPGPKMEVPSAEVTKRLGEIQKDNTAVTRQLKAATGWLTDQFGKIVKDVGEAGKADPGVLARATIGALLGFASGDTPEEAIRNALGVGLGAAASRTAAKRITEVLKSEAGAIGPRPSLQKVVDRLSGEVFPATFLGTQERVGGKPPIKLYNLTRKVADKDKGFTVSGQWLKEQGYKTPGKMKLPDARNPVILDLHDTLKTKDLDGIPVKRSVPGPVDTAVQGLKEAGHDAVIVLGDKDIKVVSFGKKERPTAEWEKMSAADQKTELGDVFDIFKDETGAVDLGRFINIFKDETGAMGRRKPQYPSDYTHQPNYGFIDAAAGVKRMMRGVYNAAKKEIAEHGRGRITNDETLIEAHNRIASGKITPEQILSWDAGFTADAADLTASRLFAVRSANEAFAQAEKAIKLGDLEAAKAAVEAAGLSKEFHKRGLKGVGTEAARTTQAAKIPVRALGVEVKITPEALAEAADAVRQNLSDMDFAKMIFHIKDAEKIARFTDGVYATAGKSALELYYGMLLSGPMTWLKNIGGNLGALPVAILDRFYAEQIGRLGSKKYQHVVPGEANQMAIGLGEAMIEEVRLLRHHQFMIERLAEMGPTKVDLLDIYEKSPRPPAITAENWGISPTNPLATAVDFLGSAVRVGPNVLSLTDASFKAINARMELRAQAFRKATYEAKQGKAFWDRFAELVENPTKDMLDAINDFKDRQTFTKDFEGRMASLQHFMGHPLVRIVVAPFFRTGVRMAEYFASHTPGLNLAAAQFWRDVSKPGPTRDLAWGRLLGGSTIIGGFMYLEYQNFITGNGPTDPKERERWIATGWQPRSVYNPWTGKFTSYEGLAPLADLIAESADLSYIIRHLDEYSGAQAFFAFTLSQMNNLATHEYMLGISEFFEAVKQGVNSEASFRLVRDRLSSWYPAVLRQIEDYLDPAQRPVVVGRNERVDDNKNVIKDNPLWAEWRALKGKMIAQTPVLSRKIPPRRDKITGEPVAHEGGWPFSLFNPLKQKTYKADSVLDELAEIELHVPDAPEYVGGTAPKMGVSLEEPNVKEGVRLEAEEIDRIIVLATSTKIGGMTLHKRLDKEINTLMYKRLKTNESKQIRLLNVIYAYYDVAVQKFRKESPKVDFLIRERLREKLTKEAGR
jgi:hypothetical protein